MSGAAAAAPKGLAADLLAIPFFRGLQPALAARYAERALWITAEPGHLITDFDEPADDVYFVLTGAVRVAVRSAGGRELILDDIPAGQFFGEMAAIDGAPRSAAVTALYRSRICRMAGSDLMALLAEAPDLARRLMRVLVERVRQVNARLLEVTTLDGRHRLYAELLRRAGPPGPKGERSISPPPVQQVLADRIGLRREAVSREIARLLRDGTLQRQRGALVIAHPAALEQALRQATES